MSKSVVPAPRSAASLSKKPSRLKKISLTLSASAAVAL